MIGTVLRVSWLNLRRDRPALILTFVVPIVFFSIFAAVFGSMDGSGFDPIDTLLVYDADEPLAAGMASALGAREELRIVARGRGEVPDAAAAANLIRNRVVHAAVVIPALSDPARPASIRLLADTSNPMVVGVVAGSLRAVGLELLRAASGDTPVLPASPRNFEVDVESVLGVSGKKPSVAFFAAGIGVMFLLFSTTGRGAILIDERESGVLTRILTSGVGMGRLLTGRWLFLVLMGTVQVSLMFVWGSFVFGLELWRARELGGFALITVASASAAAALALLLSAACRTRARLNGLATFVILIMSALGGSLFPRFMMPEPLQRLGLATFNAWALDGYHKVFWYEAPPWQLWPQITVLVASTLIFGLLARRLARRWEAEAG